MYYLESTLGMRKPEEDHGQDRRLHLLQNVHTQSHLQCLTPTERPLLQDGESTEVETLQELPEERPVLQQQQPDQKQCAGQVD